MSLKNIYKAFIAEIKLEIKSSFRYRFAIIADIIVFTALMGFLISSGTGKSFGSEYEYSNYKELFIWGYIAWTLALSGLSASTDSITTELSRGTFYRKINSKCPLSVLLFGQLIASVAIQVIVIFVLLGLANLIWKIKIHISLVMIVSLIICTIGMFGIGLMIAGYAIRYKRVSSLILLFQLGLLFITDTIPTDKSILGITQFIPLTICNNVIRNSIVSNELDYNFIFLVILSVIWLGIGYLVLNRQINKAKAEGTLLFY